MIAAGVAPQSSWVFQADNPGRDLLTQRIRIRAIAFTQQADIDRQAVRSLQHPRDVPRTRGAGRGVGTRRRAGTAADHVVVTPETSALLPPAAGGSVNMRIDAAGGDDLARFCGNGFR